MNAKSFFQVFFHDQYCAVLSAHGAGLCLILMMNLPGPIAINSSIKLPLPIPRLSMPGQNPVFGFRTVLQNISHMGCYLEGYHSFSYLGRIGKGEVFGGSDIAEVIGSRPRRQGPAHTPREMVIPYTNIDRKGAPRRREAGVRSSSCNVRHRPLSSQG